MEDDNFEPGKYWICDDCANQRGAIVYQTGNTATRGRCSWCKTNFVTLTPVRDFKWPNGRPQID